MRGGRVSVRVSVTDREPRDLAQCSHLHMDSLEKKNLGAADAQELGAALRVNTKLRRLR